MKNKELKKLLTDMYKVLTDLYEQGHSTPEMEAVMQQYELEFDPKP